MVTDCETVNMYSRKSPKRYSGFTAIKKDGTIEKTQKRYNGFIVEDESSKVEELPAKKDEAPKKDL